MRASWLALVLAACGSLPGGDDDGTCCDTTPACDACDLDAGDATGDASSSTDGPDAGGRPQGAACDLLLEQCAQGLTCRGTGVSSSPFVCQPVGAAGAGELCVSVNDCGANMGCFPAGGGQRRCYLFCDTANPVRCQAGETCYAQGGLPPEYPATTGVCGP